MLRATHMHCTTRTTSRGWLAKLSQHLSALDKCRNGALHYGFCIHFSAPNEHITYSMIKKNYVPFARHVNSTVGMLEEAASFRDSDQKTETSRSVSGQLRNVGSREDEGSRTVTGAELEHLLFSSWACWKFLKYNRLFSKVQVYVCEKEATDLEKLRSLISWREDSRGRSSRGTAGSEGAARFCQDCSRSFQEKLKALQPCRLQVGVVHKRFPPLVGSCWIHQEKTVAITVILAA